MLNIKPGQTLVCDSCGQKATVLDFQNDKLRMYLRDGRVLCELCNEDAQEQDE